MGECAGRQKSNRPKVVGKCAKGEIPIGENLWIVHKHEIASFCALAGGRIGCRHPRRKRRRRGRRRTRRPPRPGSSPQTTLHSGSCLNHGPFWWSNQIHFNSKMQFCLTRETCHKIACHFRTRSWPYQAIQVTNFQTWSDVLQGTVTFVKIRPGTLRDEPALRVELHQWLHPQHGTAFGQAGLEFLAPWQRSYSVAEKKNSQRILRVLPERTHSGLWIES